MYQTLLGRFLFPTYYRIKGDAVMTVTSELRRNQWWTHEQVLDTQNRKLQALLSHAYKTVTYYRKIIDGNQLSLRSLSNDYNNFQKLPILTKSIIRQNLPNLISSDLRGNSISEYSTSGSTGENLSFYRDKRSMLYREATVIVNQEWTGFRIGEKKVFLWGAPMDLSKSKTLHGKLHGLLTGTVLLSSYDLNSATMNRYAEILTTFKPKLLVSYPGPLEVFAEYISERKLKFPSIKAIITSAEQLDEHQRTVIEETFRVKIFDRYGSREMGTIAQECECHSGLHLNSFRFVLEILNEQGLPAPPGELGELYITDLDNYGMPMLRYQIGDRAMWAEDAKCACGRGFPLLSKVEGRSLDVIKTPKQQRIGGTFWTLLFRSQPGIRRFQVRQDDINGVAIHYVPERGFAPCILEVFERKIKEKCGRDFIVKFIEKENIDTTQSGKHRFIISNC